MAASAAYSELPVAASGAIAVATSSATVPSGPMTTCRADPKTAYARTGTRRAYRPALTGTPASSANAMAEGRANAATVMPATMSVRSRVAEYVDRVRARGTYRVAIGGRLSDAKAPRPW